MGWGALVGILASIYLTFTNFSIVVLFVLVSGRWSIAVMNEQLHATRKAGERDYTSDLEILMRRATLPTWLVIYGFMVISIVQSDSFRAIKESPGIRRY